MGMIAGMIVEARGMKLIRRKEFLLKMAVNSENRKDYAAAEHFLAQAVAIEEQEKRLG